MKTAVKTLIKGILFALIVLSVATAIYKSNERNDRLQLQIDQDEKAILQSKQREVAYTIQIMSAEVRRAHAENRFDSLVAAYGALDRTHAATLAELSKVKGSFNNLSSKQLSDKMIEQYNKRKR